MAARADDHVELFANQHVDHPWCGLRIISEVAIGHHINVRVDVREHPHYDVALALQPLGADNRASLRRKRARPVTAIIVVDIDYRAGQRALEARDSRADRSFLVVAREEHGDAWLLCSWHALPCLSFPATSRLRLIFSIGGKRQTPGQARGRSTSFLLGSSFLGRWFCRDLGFACLCSRRILHWLDLLGLG